MRDTRRVASQERKLDIVCKAMVLKSLKARSGMKNGKKRRKNPLAFFPLPFHFLLSSRDNHQLGFFTTRYLGDTLEARTQQQLLWRNKMLQSFTVNK